MSELLNAIKQVASNANEASKPVALVYGTVTRTSPLKILVEQKLEVNDKVLILTNAVKDHYVDMTFSFSTALTKLNLNHDINATIEDGGEPEHTHDIDITAEAHDASHNHAISGTTKVMVHNGLKIGEKVIMLRVQQGQQFLVIDRVS